MKDASKASTSSTEPAVTAADPVPTSAQPITVTQPPTSLPQVPAQPQVLPTFPTVTHPHPVTTFTPFPGFTQGVQPYQQVGGGYLTPMFTQNTVPYDLFGPGPGFPNFPTRNPPQHYQTAGPYQPTRDDWFPIPSTSRHSFQHPIHSTTFPESYHSGFHEPRHTDFYEPRYTSFSEPHCTGFPELRHTGPPKPHHSGFPRPRHTGPPEPHYRRTFADHQSQAPTRLLSPEPFDNLPDRFDFTEYQEDPSPFPTLQEWFVSIDSDPRRHIRGDEYSQYSHAFDLRGFKLLLDLEGVKPNQLFEEFGIAEAAAHRLLKFAEEDIQSIRDGIYTPRTRA